MVNVLGYIAKVANLRFQPPVPVVLLQKLMLVEEAKRRSAGILYDYALCKP